MKLSAFHGLTCRLFGHDFDGGYSLTYADGTDGGHWCRRCLIRQETP